ncbi:Uncharacterized protein BP5553_04509 [Venustampulla echinocandica]|uniref:Transmembrane protein n=1 Tax=Venustampulla echinocandica TaxID=2656787 RepID=A0A370TNG9_9HELO|nr:Uncharacterized protein BP5553_04509 [Venustampulla echinocandica]RDL37076.1 Uncharacterized protein BP5553_04509 [Venustampulla echinocandica]
MRTILLLSVLLNLFFLRVAAQNTNSITSSQPTPTSSVSLTPEMSASAASSLFSTLATSVPQQPGEGPAPGDAGSSAGNGDSTAGAAGPDSGSITLSKGGIIAIIVIAVSVCVFGVVTSVLWYYAKKRSWEVRKTIRKSARRVATALTPRRTAFPKDALNPRRGSTRGLTRINEVPDTPRAPVDVEKGKPKLSSFEMSEPPQQSKWGRKFGG